MSDFLVTYLVPVTVRVEGYETKDEAAERAWEMWNMEEVVKAGQIGLDHTSFYFYHDGGTELPWALDVVVEQDPPIDNGVDTPQSCGCPIDYHMADCPRLTDRYSQGDPPEPDDDYNPDHEENE